MEKEVVNSRDQKALRTELEKIQDCFQVATEKWQALLKDFESFKDEASGLGFEELFGDILKNAEQAHEKIKGLSSHLHGDSTQKPEASSECSTSSPNDDTICDDAICPSEPITESIQEDPISSSEVSPDSSPPPVEPKKSSNLQISIADEVFKRLNSKK